MNSYRKVRLTDHRSANCFVRVYENGDMCLQSYATDVLYYVKATGFLYCSGTYSQTTRKHISWFIREYFHHCAVSYQDMKECYEDDLKYHVGINALRPLTPSERDLMRNAHSGCSLYPHLF